MHVLCRKCSRVIYRDILNSDADSLVVASAPLTCIRAEAAPMYYIHLAARMQ